ncbi:uncharacterized protein LOC109950839 [Prunus persica]|uniref:uncharacterized protein LOC109950839 n=1 Tax=Prunus persica TaxID=3760 RepID=UPI0009AB2F8C|nr:uncharacterized protein LOC109950839 [Prunus persica]
MEVERANSSPFTVEIEQATLPKRFSTTSFTCFKGDSNLGSHLKHFKSLMILYKVEEVLMCKVFAMNLRGAAQDWFHTLPSGSISSFKELAYVFTKEYTSYRKIKKNPNHLYNLRKKPDESLQDYIKRFKAKNANIIGCDDPITSSAFKKGLPAEHDLYHELTITPNQTLAEVIVTAELYALWDDDRIAAKKSTEQEAQVKDKPWVKKPSPLKGDPDKRDTRKYCAFHVTYGYNTNNYFAWKAHLKELVREGHYTEFIAKQAIQRIEDCDTAKEPPQKVIKINTILADF